MIENFIEINHLNIHFVTVNNSNQKTIFFIHGNSGSHKTWHHQLNSERLKKFHLIAFDLPAHAQSSANKDASLYGPKEIALLLSKAIEQLIDDKPFILCGISLGANIIAEMLLHLKPSGVAIYSPTIMGGKYQLPIIAQPNSHVGLLFQETAEENELQLYFNEAFYNKKEEEYSIAMKDYFSVKAPFRNTLLQKALNGIFENEIVLLEKFSQKILVVFGKNDAIINPNYLDDTNFKLFENKIFKLEKASHYVIIDQSETATELLVNYAEEIFT